MIAGKILFAKSKQLNYIHGMDDSLIALAKRRLVAAEEELRSLPLYQEVEKLRAFIAVAKELSLAQECKRADKQGVDVFVSDWRTPVSLKAKTPGREVKKDLIENAAVAELQVKFPQTSSELLDKLNSAGVEVGGTDPLVNLSAYLSKSGLFVHKRKLGGWFLKEQYQDEEKKENPLPLGQRVN